jgi:hypothetical protein
MGPSLSGVTFSFAMRMRAVGGGFARARDLDDDRDMGP